MTTKTTNINGGNMENGHESTALAVVVPRGEIISTQELRAGLASTIEQQEILGQFVAKAMTEGIDYGTIPGTEKLIKKPDGSTEKAPNRTLLKPGAEKLVTLFRCRPRFRLKRLEDWDKGFFAYEFRCEILTGAGDVVAEGFGSANSREGRYRWRNAARACPSCGKDTIIKGKAEYGGGWICFAKKGGCGAKFSAGDQAIEGQEQGRVDNDDIASLANTILKMAKKRALVDAALALSRCSDLFGQDLEDLDESGQLGKRGAPRDVTPPPPVEDAEFTEPVRTGRAPRSSRPQPPEDTGTPKGAPEPAPSEPESVAQQIASYVKALESAKSAAELSEVAAALLDAPTDVRKSIAVVEAYRARKAQIGGRS